MASKCKIFELGSASGNMIPDLEEEINKWLKKRLHIKIVSTNITTSLVGSIIISIFYEEA
jgi:hypothetical protein